MAQFGAAPWTITPEESSKSEMIFNSLKPNAGKISGEQAKKYFMMSNLPTPVLGHIWTLSDMDNDGKMTLQEFSIALHLIQAKCRGTEIPKVLPYSLKSSSASKKSVFDSGFSAASSSSMMTHMSNGAAPLASGGILTPMSYGGSASVGSGSFSNASQSMPYGGHASTGSGSFSNPSQSMPYGGSASGITSSFSNQAQPPGFHTGYAGSNTFPRNMPPMHLSSSTPQFSNSQSGMSSLDDLAGLSAGWGHSKPDNSIHTSISRASSLKTGIAAQSTPQSSLSSISGLQFGTSLSSNSSVGQSSAFGPPASFGRTQASFGQTPASFGQTSAFGQPASIGVISPANRMKYSQMFKAADHEKNGFLRGDQARQLLIQSGISPDKLAKIWDLSDLNKDGNLDLDEFIIAMHLIDVVKTGQPIPAAVPQGLIPPGKKFIEPEVAKPDAPVDGGKKRSDSVTSMGKMDAVTFEDRRKDNFEKGRLELERRRKEIEDRMNKEKEERERKEREEEEKKRKIREEAERRRLQKLENERIQKEEMEREQENERRKLIEQRHAAQLEAERQRQREWEKRRKEELLNQKGLEVDIVTGLKLRLEKLKGELNQETMKRDELAKSLNNKKINFSELIASIAQLNKSKEFGVSQINLFKSDIQKMKTLVSQLKGERERLNVEINKRDTTTTSEALGGVRASIHQTKANIPRLKGQLLAFEAETDVLLKDNDSTAKQLLPLKTALQIKVDENTRLKQHQETKKREYQAARQRIEDETRRLDAINRQKKEEEEQLRRQAEAKRKKEEMAMKQREEERRKQKQKERDAMLLEQQRQEESLRRIHQAQAAEKQSKMEKAKQITQEALQKQQEIRASKPDITSMFAASKESSSASQDLLGLNTITEPPKTIGVALPAPPKKEKRPVAPPRPKTRPVVAKPDIVIPKAQDKVEKSNWDALADLDSDRKREEEKEKAEKLRLEEEERRAEEQRKKEEARKKIEEEKRKREEAVERKKEEERRKGEAERRRWEEELRAKEEMELEKQKKRKEEERRKGEEERRRWEEEHKRKEIERQKEEEKKRMEEQRREEELKKQKEADVRKKVEEMQKMRQLKKQQQKPAEQSPKASDAETPPTSQTEPTIKPKSRFKALFPFEARHNDELTLHEGDIIQVDETDTTPPPGWYRGSKDGVVGLFPTNYVEKLPNDTFSDYVDLDKNATAPSTQPKKALVPKPRPLSKPIPITAPESIPNPASKPRASSLLETVPEHERTSSYGSSEGTDSAMSLTGGGSSVKSIASSFEKHECYENVQPPLSAEGPSPSNATLKLPEGLQAVALYPYRGKKEDDLTFNKNDQIIVQEQQDLWWYGECSNKTGWFPKSYVKVIGTVKTAVSIQDDFSEASSIASSTSSVTTEHSGGDHSFVGECVALFDYSGIDGDLSFNEGDTIKITKKESDWWEGVLKGECGFFPANYVKVKEAVESPKKPEVATVTSAFAASDGREISLNPGQLVQVLKKDPGGWWQGEVQARGKKRQVGWFPANCVKLLAQSKTPEQTKPVEKPAMEDEDIYSVPQKRETPADQVLALFSYTAQNEDELTFYKGSVINVIQKEGDWWKGELNGQVGMFPYNYVQLLTDMPDNSGQWEGSFDTAVLNAMSKSERERQNYIHELINTEQAFMDDLSLTLEIFYNPMAEAHILNEQELNTVFVNWREIIMCNTKLLKALLVRKTMSDNNKIEAIGDILVEQIPRFTPYIRFCSCQLKACKLLQHKVENDPDFKQFEKKCAGDRRLRQNLPLSSYLLKPLQRITKYPLIVKQIIKHTPEIHHDRQNLEQALEKIEELCSQINESIRMVESANRLEWLQSHVNLEGLGEKLVFNSQTNCLGQRKYLHHSTLYKHKSNKELRAFLFNDFLLLCRQQGTNPIARTITNIFKDNPEGEASLTIYKKPIFLNEIVVKMPNDPEVNDTLFSLSHIDRIYLFRTETKNERNAWVSKLQKASEHFIETERFQRKRAHRARSVLGQGVGRLTLLLIEGCDLKASDPTGTSDPYCEVSMGSQEHKTKVIAKTLNPKWNSQMIFTVKDLDQDVLCFTVFDRDFFSPNDFLGRTELSIANLLKEGPGPWNKRLLLHEVPTGEIVLRASFQKFEKR